MKKRKGNKEGKGRPSSFEDWDSIRASKAQNSEVCPGPALGGLLLVSILAAAYYYQSTGDQSSDSVEEDPATDKLPAELIRKMTELEMEEAEVTANARAYWRARTGTTRHTNVPTCAKPIAGFKTKRSHNQEIVIRVSNQHHDGCSVYWVDDSGKEMYMSDVDPGQEWSSGTYTGHAWRIKDTDGGILLERLAEADSDGATTSGKQAYFTVRVEPCDPTPNGGNNELLQTGEPGFSIQEECPQLSEWLSIGISKGFHPLCIHKSGPTEVEMAAYVGGRRGSSPASASSDCKTGKQFRLAVEKLVGMPHAHTDDGLVTSREKFNPQPWAIFATSGHVIDTHDDAIVQNLEGLVLVFVGGRFIYPGIELGYKRVVDAHDKQVVLETMSLQPLVFSVENFLEAKECAHIIRRSKKHMSPSKVSLMDKDKGKADKEFRTSSTYFLSSRGDPVLLNVDQRVANLTRTIPAFHEDVQVLRYDGGQYYDETSQIAVAAGDLLVVFDSYTQPDIVNMVHGGHKNRLVTVFWYMSDVQLGGETNFPSATGFGPISHPSVADECKGGLRVHPRKGRVIVFYSLLPDGSGDQKSLHGACPVGHGQKWAANKWVWNQQYRG